MYEELIGIINDLCDTLLDLPCGCDICPYNETIDPDAGECQVHRMIQQIDRFESE